MKTKQHYLLVIPFFLCVAVLYLVYRVYHTEQLNLRLEGFMAEQVIPLQDKWYSDMRRQIPGEYFIQRHETYSFLIKNALVQSRYDSYWISSNGSQKQLTLADWMSEKKNKYQDEIVSWWYWIRPVSGSVVCVGLEGFLPRDWTAGGMGSSGGYLVFTIDTAKPDWNLVERNDLHCYPSNDTWFEILLLSVS